MCRCQCLWRSRNARVCFYNFIVSRCWMLCAKDEITYATCHSSASLQLWQKGLTVSECLVQASLHFISTKHFFKQSQLHDNRLLGSDWEFSKGNVGKLHPQSTFSWSEGISTNGRKRQSHSPATCHQEASQEPLSRLKWASSKDECEEEWRGYTFHKVISGDPKSFETSVEIPKKKTLWISAHFTWLNLPFAACPCRWLKAPVFQHQTLLKPDDTLGGRSHPKLTITFFCEKPFFLRWWFWKVFADVNHASQCHRVSSPTWSVSALNGTAKKEESGLFSMLFYTGNKLTLTDPDGQTV